VRASSQRPRRHRDAFERVSTRFSADAPLAALEPIGCGMASSTSISTPSSDTLGASFAVAIVNDSFEGDRVCGGSWSKL